MSLRRLVTVMRALRNWRAQGKKLEADGSTLPTEDSRAFSEPFNCPMDTSNEGIMEKLDKETMIYILSLLVSPSDLARAACVCRSWSSYVVQGKLWKNVCISMFPEIGTNSQLLNQSEALPQNTKDGTEQSKSLKAQSCAYEVSPQNTKDDTEQSKSLKAQSCAYEVLLSSLLRPPMQRTCISEPLHATSTDNLPIECIAQTLHPEPEYDDVAIPSYWSSRGHPDRNRPEMLTYRLVSDLCVVDNVQVRPFLADFQAGHPIYSAQMVRFRFGYPRVSRPHWAGLMECLLDGSEKEDADDYVWTYESPTYQMAQEDTLQTFKLPKPTLCIGGIFQLELLGRVQTQASDGQFYICICHVHVSGCPLMNFKFDGVGSDGQIMLKQLGPKPRPSCSVDPITVSTPQPRRNVSFLLERLRSDRILLNHMHREALDAILQYLLDAGFFEAENWQQDYA